MFQQAAHQPGAERGDGVEITHLTLLRTLLWSLVVGGLTGFVIHSLGATLLAIVVFAVVAIAPTAFVGYLLAQERAERDATQQS